MIKSTVLSLSAGCTRVYNRIVFGVRERLVDVLLNLDSENTLDYRVSELLEGPRLEGPLPREAEPEVQRTPGNHPR